MSNSEHIVKLKTLAVTGKVLTENDDLIYYGKDWTKFFEPNPIAIVLPKSTSEVQAVVKYCNENQLKVVPSGGRTGLSAGAVAAHGEVVIALDLMNNIIDKDALEGVITCQAGLITEQLQNAAEDMGMYYPVDFASAGSSQIGGNIATNAGGIKVIKYGMTRDWVIGLKVVTGSGEVLDLNKGLIKNATGYDFRHLFIGSEGTLGIITEATIKLASKPTNLNVLVLGLPSMDAVMPVLHAFQSKIELTAFEFFSDVALDIVLSKTDLSRPFETPTPFYALIEFEADNEAVIDTAMEIFEHCLEQEWVHDGVISQSDQQVEKLWRLREDISESIAEYTPYKNDISVRTGKVPEFLTAVDAIVSKEYPDFKIVWFGHIGDGNLHLNILKPVALDKEQFFDRCKQVNQWVFEQVKRFDGSISAEHGVGLSKKPYLHISRSEAEISLMKQIKLAFDPNNVINPGKIFDL
jgi:glycolate oxidase subunit GlcD